MVTTKNKVYKLEPEIPEEIYLDVVVPDFFKDDIKRLSSAIGVNVKDIPYLGDMFFSVVASHSHYQSFMRLHSQLLEFIKKKTSEMLTKREDIAKGRSEIILAKVVPFIHLLIPLDSFITSAKRTLDFSMRFTIKLLFKKDYKYLSINKLSECFMKNRMTFGNINERFKRDFPEFRLKFIEEWNEWMKDLNEKRVNVTHYVVLKEGVFDVRFLRNGEKEDMVSIELIAKELKKPYEFLESTFKKFDEYFIWIVKYNLEHCLDYA